LPKPKLLGTIKTKSRTELELCRLLAYLIRPGFEEEENSKPRLLAIVKKSLVWIE